MAAGEQLSYRACRVFRADQECYSLFLGTLIAGITQSDRSEQLGQFRTMPSKALVTSV